MSAYDNMMPILPIFGNYTVYIFADGHLTPTRCVCSKSKDTHVSNFSGLTLFKKVWTLTNNAEFKRRESDMMYRFAAE